MRAYLLPEPGAAPRFAEVPVPEPAHGEVLVRITASSVNPHDAMVASGAAARYMEYRYPVVLGSDVAGTVVALGDAVDDLSPGDRVFGLVRELVAARGSFAELVAIPASGWPRSPTAWSTRPPAPWASRRSPRCAASRRSPPSPVKVVLVNGATGGVGSYALQLLLARGARVVATARPGDEEKHVREMGATNVVDWSDGDLAELVHALHRDGVDAVVDLVNRDQDAFTALATRVLRPGGRVACTGHAADPARLHGIRATNVRAEVDQDALRTLAGLAATGQLRAPITRFYDLADVGEAFEALRAGAIGKLALRH